MKLPSLPYLAENFTTVLRRFPLVMIAAATGVVAAMMLVDRELGGAYSELSRILITSSIGLPLLLSAAAMTEKYRWKGIRALLPSIIALVLLAVYYLTLDMRNGDPSVATMIRYTGLNLCAHLLVAFLPFLDKTPAADFWEYNKRLFGNFVVGAFYSFIIFGGLAIAIVAVDNLFNVDVNNEIYAHLFIFIAGIFNTAYFLANFPRQFEGLSNGDSAYTTAFKNLSKFILIPIVGIYFLILYAYSVKILITWELPAGWVSSLVLGFSIAGIFTYLLNYMLVEFDGSNLVHGFRRWFFFVLFPMVILLFAGIGRRISDYGVTEERYVVAAAGIWLLLVSLYFIFSKKDNIKFIPVSLCVFALFTVLGPFNAFQVSKRSQVDRLEEILIKNNMLVDGKATAPADSLSNSDAENISSILYYLSDHDYFEAVGPWFGLPADKESPEWEELNRIMTSLRLTPNEYRNDYCSAYFPQESGFSTLGFDTLYKINAFQPDLVKQDGFFLSAYGPVINWKKNSEVADSFNLMPFVTRLSEKYGCNKGNFDPRDAVIEISGNRYSARFITENITYEQRGQLKLRDWNGIILLKRAE